MKESKRHSKLTDLEKRKMNLVFQAWIIEKMGAIVKKGRQSRSIYPKGERLIGFQLCLAKVQQPASHHCHYFNSTCIS